jgi:single-strand DNA-binding protein
MLNRIILIGRLTRDPELRYTANGVARTTFTLAVDRPYTNQQGQREADFINIVTWRQLAELCANYLRKGRLAAVEGRLEIRTFENNEGQRIRVTEVVADNVRFLESRSQGASGGSFGETPPSTGFGGPQPFGGMDDDADPFANEGTPIDISEDDLPF